MIFGKKKDGSDGVEPQSEAARSGPGEMVFFFPPGVSSAGVAESCASLVPGGTVRASSVEKISAAELRRARHAVAIHQPNDVLTKLLEALATVRQAEGNGYPTLIVVAKPSELRALGSWLTQHGETEKLQGVRLAVASDLNELPGILATRLTPVKEPNIIRMPVSPEVECKVFKNFFAMSDELRSIVRHMRELAENNIYRVYLLGAPGAGKTTLAYHYYLCRGKGNFVAVNLTAESTGDKESMKSLICGHVPGALPGANSREGALSFAGEGVCFLDESHGVTGVVMQVLMEVLDSGQYLPYGGTKKRSLDCAVIFASNRSWEALREMMNLDEHARLGATLIKLSDLAAREEDLIAVLATTLDNFSKKCTTWKPPTGISPAAWAEYKKCQWRGNTRTLIRVTETACVSWATAGSPDGVVGSEFVKEGLDLWEPATHSTAGMYVSFRPEAKDGKVTDIPNPEATSRFPAAS